MPPAFHTMKSKPLVTFLLLAFATLNVSAAKQRPNIVFIFSDDHAYQAISAYLALDPPRGQRRQVLDQLAHKTWTLPDGRPVRFAAETLRTWVRRYRRGGLAALEDAPRPRPGVQVLDEDEIQTLVKLRTEVPERSLDRLLEMAEDTGLVPKGKVSRSTLHRVLAAHGVSGRPKGKATTTDLDRFEAAAPNDLWQSDMLAGP